MDLIISNWVSVVIVLGILVGLLVLYKAGRKEVVRNIVLALVIKAEKKLGSGTGELKYALVIESFYNRLPAIIRFLFTTKELDKMIEDSLDNMKKVLGDDKTLTGYDDEHYIDIISKED